MDKQGPLVLVVTPPIHAFLTRLPFSDGELRDQTRQLEALQRMVDGYVEVIRPHPQLRPDNVPGWHAFVNEEGLIRAQPFNPIGTAVARIAGWASNSYLVGPVVFCGDSTPPGLTWSAPDLLSTLVRSLGVPIHREPLPAGVPA